MDKQQIIDALRDWIRQRPGLDFGNYGDVSAYRSELRTITKDLHHARQLLRAVELRDSITAADLTAAFRAYSGRMTLTEKNGKPALDYCTGQYWPTEYRKVVCAIAASALWERRRQDMPTPTIKQHGSAENRPMQTVELYDGLNAGDWIRRSFRREYGRGIAQRWFS